MRQNASPRQQRLRPGFLRIQSQGWLGGVIVDAKSELYTKSTAQELVLAANMSGCAFVGRSLVEGTGSLRNFTVTAHKLGTDDLMLAYIDSACALVRAIMAFEGYRRAMPKLTVLHASNHKTSNTFGLCRRRARPAQRRRAGLRRLSV